MKVDAFKKEYGAPLTLYSELTDYEIKFALFASRVLPGIRVMVNRGNSIEGIREELYPLPCKGFPITRVIAPEFKDDLDELIEREWMSLVKVKPSPYAQWVAQ